MKPLFTLITCIGLALPVQADLITTSFGYTSDTDTGIITNADNTLEWLPFDVGNGVSLSDLTLDLSDGDGNVFGLDVGDGWRLASLSDIIGLANDVNPSAFFTFDENSSSSFVRNTNALAPGLLDEFVELFGNTFDTSDLALTNPSLNIITSRTAVFENDNFYGFFFDEGSNGQLAVFDNTSFLSSIGETRTTDIYPYGVVRDVNAPLSAGLLALGMMMCLRRRNN